MLQDGERGDRTQKVAIIIATISLFRAPKRRFCVGIFGKKFPLKNGILKAFLWILPRSWNFFWANQGGGQ